MSLKYSRLLFPIGVLFFTTGSLFSQVDKSSKLFKDIRSNDSLLFEVGFDRCDTIALRDILSNNFEFYHDESGIIPSKAAYIESIVELRKLPYKARRQLIENTL